jgi:hypothetical protein
MVALLQNRLLLAVTRKPGGNALKVQIMNGKP